MANLNGDFWARWKKEEEERRRQDMEKFQSLAAKKGFDYIVAHFAGSGDNGGIESSAVFDPGGKKVELTDQEMQIAESVVYSHLPGGWEINDGSDGYIVINSSGKVFGDIGWFVTQQNHEPLGKDEELRELLERHKEDVW